MKNLLFVGLVVLFMCNSCQSQNSNVIIKRFIEKVKDDDTSYEEVLDQYFIITEKNDSNKKLLKSQLSELKKILTDCSKYDILEYQYAKKNKIQGFFEIEIEENNYENIYFIKCNKSLIPILIENNKISSFTTMKKGNYGYFIII